MEVTQTIFKDNVLLEIVARLLIAFFAGFIIGFERKMRFKEAGIRTHSIVCIGACLFTLLSVYAFEGSDPARIAAQVIPGIGFLGAGMIFYHKETIHGLTTAAGIWTTAAIGMAVGSGWLIIAAVATVIILLVQYVLHMNVKAFHTKRFVKINLVFLDKTGTECDKLKNFFGVSRFDKISAKNTEDGIVYNVVISSETVISASDIYRIIEQNPAIISIARQDDDF
ncbi:MAG: MgtC/SapB family protein [Clostridiales bacterium]|nr:MgtC/SapB family protein [Clostridiales bacterium]